MPSEVAVGIDFGGTKTNAAAVTQTGEVLGDVLSMPTAADRSAHSIVDDMAKLVTQAANAAGKDMDGLAGIGIGAPGPLDLETGVFIDPPNLLSLHNFPLRAEIEKRLGVRAYVNNDGNCFVLGEALYGAGRGSSIVCGVTLGTGFGGGIVMDGRIFGGATGTAAEVWKCRYKDGMFEDYGSGRGVSVIYRRLMGEEASAAELNKRAAAGEKAARQAWSEYGADLGVILSYLANVLDPEVIVVGGSVSDAWDWFAESMNEFLAQNIHDLPRAHLNVRRASLGSLAGIVGAAALVWGQD